MNNPRPRVSVCVMTYNQKDYIGQCLQSLVDQVVNFDFEIIVGDDCSQDGTAGVVRDFSNRYPKLIHPIIHEKNIGVFCNYWSVHLAARGEYIAHMDGDDYALPGKLVEQVEFLDENITCVMCGHDMTLVRDGSVIKTKRAIYPEVSTIKSFLLYGNFVPHSSSMYRSAFRLTPNQFNEFMIDFQLHVARVGNDYIGYINKPLGVYRIVNDGMVSGYYNSVKSFNSNVAAIDQIESVVGSVALIDRALFKLCFVWIKNLIVARRRDLAEEVFNNKSISRFSFWRRLFLRSVLFFSPIFAIAFRIKRKFRF